MRLVAYCPPEHAELVKTSIGIPAEFHEEWPVFEKSVRGADCAVAVLRWLNEAPGAVEFRRLRSSQPETEFVLVTRFDRENGYLLPDTADRVVWLADVGERLNAAIVETTHGLCLRLQRFVRTRLPNSRNGRAIRDALLVLLRLDPPVRTVKEWCALVPVSCSVSTLQKRFASAFDSGITPLWVVEAVRLFRALDEFPNARSWTEMAANAGSRWYEDGQLSPETLSNMAARLLGKVRVPAEIRRSHVPSDRLARWDPPLVEKPSDVDRRALLEGLVALLR